MIEDCQGQGARRCVDLVLGPECWAEREGWVALGLTTTSVQGEAGRAGEPGDPGEDVSLGSVGSKLGLSMTVAYGTILRPVHISESLDLASGSCSLGHTGSHILSFHILRVCGAVPTWLQCAYSLSFIPYHV